MNKTLNFKFSFYQQQSLPQANIEMFIFTTNMFVKTSLYIQRSTSSLNRICRCVHQPTWTTPYGRYISCWLTQRASSPPLQHKSGCELHCLTAHRGKLTHTHNYTSAKIKRPIYSTTVEKLKSMACACDVYRMSFSISCNLKDFFSFWKLYSFIF